MQPHILKYSVLSLVVFLAGAIVGVFSAPYLPLGTGNTYQDGFNAAKELVENSGIVAATKTPDDARTISGTVSAVSGTGFTIHILSTDPFASLALADRTVLVDSSTTVIKLVPKDPKTLQSEMDAFVKATQAGGDVSKIIPPTPVTDVPGSISDIAVGDFVTIIATENVGALKEFSAAQVQVQGESTATTTAPAK